MKPLGCVRRYVGDSNERLEERGDGGQKAISAGELGFDDVSICFLFPTISREFHQFCSKGWRKGHGF